MKKVYEGSTIEKCLEKVCEEFRVSKEILNFKILKEKKSLFRKKTVIEVDIPDEYLNETKYSLEKENNDLEIIENVESIENIEKSLLMDEKNGTIKIVDGKIIIKNPKEGGKPASILVGNNVKVLIDGNEFKGKKEVFEETNIEVFFEENIASREMKITLSENYMEAYVTITYEPKNIYKLKDNNEKIMITLEGEVASAVNPPKYSIEEVKNELSNNNVVYGIIEDNLRRCVENSCEKVLVAKGQPVKDGTNDTIQIKFKTDVDIKKLKEDKGGNIDFKSIGSVAAVYKGDIIAVRLTGDEGQDGYDVIGNIKKHKIGKKIKLKAGDGCILSDENTVVAAIEGKPCIKSNTFYIYQVHEVKGDVDLKTGNIKFIGDVIVYGNVNEGMEVECGNSLDIQKDVERAKIKANGNIDIKGNVIASKIIGGGEDVKKIKTLKDLESLKKNLASLIEAVKEVKKFNLLGQDRKDGEVIKVLIENKFKNMPRLCLSVITDLRLLFDCIDEEINKNLSELITGKLLGISPVSIKHYSELDLILNSIDEILLILSSTLSIPVNLQVPYCQDSSLHSSGDILVTGKGEYISDLTANGSIYFTQEKSVARGGVLKAKEEIKCRTVGSTAGVSTKLQVEKDGHIWVDTAYQNTILVVGAREFILDVPSKNVHAYLKDKDDIIVDRFKL